ncbi:L-cysteine:1D-myo-inositol 2-amino-2-deoxy-alpha-D-glucopyranoside ligase [Actinomycetes bacterium]|nr:L-cysteine:1D-myo-inositol 2-amino-2-deoxy-alpha-D-glucopyranoside ligase [Actinomycetes bacterium]
MFDSKSQQNNEIGRNGKKVQIYVCGITPYDSAHLGHAFTYLTFDLVIRALKFIGRETNYVQNITDIDDPLFERARNSGTNWQSIVDSQMDIYRTDMSALNILPPDHFVGVMENMDLIISRIGETISKDLSYQIGTEWYFKTDSEKLSKLVASVPNNELVAMAKERGCDTDRQGKISPLDPIIWKASKDDEPNWKEDFGTGRPGWHIQCISLANKYAELPLDIQGGGKDLIFPHHSMSEEQNAALGFGELALNYCHVGMVSYQGSKMSKSKGNLVFVHQLMDEGISPMVIRLALMSHHWRADWEYTKVLIDESKEFYSELSKKFKGKFISQIDQDQIIEIMLNDLDAPKVLSFLKEVKPLSESQNNVSIDLLLEALLGLKLEDVA